MTETEKRRKLIEAVLSITTDSLWEDKRKEAEELEMHLAVTWEDIGGVGNNKSNK
jgi:hypothetical protein